MWILVAASIIALVVCLVFWIRSRDDLVIVSSHYKEDIEWLKRSKWPVIICDKPGGSETSFDSDPTCTLNENRGREASSYLKYIIENYDNLPNKIAFIHGHEDADHQRYPRGILQAIEDARSDEFDFISLNNWIHLKKDTGSQPQLPNHPTSHEFGDHPKIYEEMRNNWDTVFRPFLGIDIPQYFRFQSCAQFIVTRRAIHRHPNSVYQKLYDFIMEPGSDDWARGVVLEFTWHMIFTEQGHDICNDPSDISMYESCNDEAYRKSRFNF
jgi:hypothetical protein